MMKQSLNSICGKKNNKGLIFTLDSLIAAIILFTIIGYSSYYISKSESEISKLQISRTGSDIAALLENQGVFDSMNPSSIEASLSDILPQNYQININITCEDDELTNSSYVLLGETAPAKEFISSGRRFFVISHDDSADFCMTQYKIWQK